MSHVVTSPCIITDLECLERALKKFPKLKLLKDKKTYKWYGKWMNDYDAKDAAYKLGIDPKQYGKCEQCLHMDGVEYEIGVVKRMDGKGWSLVWDFFADGHRLSEYIGVGAEHLMSEYNRQCMLKSAEESAGTNLTVSETDDEIMVEYEVEQADN